MSFSESADPAAATAPDPAAEPPREPESVLQIGKALLSVLRELPKLVGDRVELLALDLQRAGLALGQIVGLIVALAILGVTVWLLVWAGVLLALVMVGLPRWGALLVAIAINGIGLWWVVSQIRSRVPKLVLATFRRHLGLTPAPPVPVPVPPLSSVPPAAPSQPPPPMKAETR